MLMSSQNQFLKITYLRYQLYVDILSRICVKPKTKYEERDLLRPSEMLSEDINKSTDKSIRLFQILISCVFEDPYLNYYLFCYVVVYEGGLKSFRPQHEDSITRK